MAETGTIAHLIGDKPFGFIRRPDGTDLFFHFSKYPKGPKPLAGDELEYEVATDPSKPAGKQTFADHIKLVKKAPVPAPSPAATPATPSPAGVARTSPPPTTAPLPVPLDFDVTFAFSEPVASEDKFELGLAVVVTDNAGNPVRNAQVSLKTNIGQIEDEPFTGTSGEAPFLVEIVPPTDDAGLRIGPPLSITALLFTATIRYQGKSLTRSEHWPPRKLKVQPAIVLAVPAAPKAKPRPAGSASTTVPASTTSTTPASSAVPPQLQATISDGAGYKQFDVTYGAQGALVPATFTVSPTRGCQLACREQGQAGWQTQPGKFDFPSNGRKVVQVKIEKLAPDVGGENIFIGVQGTTVQSGPHYISGVQ